MARASISVEVGLRAAVAAAVPLLLLLAFDCLDLAAYAMFGAFTALYGRNEPYRLRVRSVSVAGTALIVCVAVGVGLAVIDQPLLLLAVLLVLVVVGGSLLSTIFQFVPAQPFFFVFALLLCAAVPTPAAEALPRIALTAGAALFSWVLTMSGWLVRRALRARDIQPVTNAILIKKLRRRPEVDVAAVRDGEVWLTVAQNVVGALLAGAVALSLGLGHPYWAVVSVVAVIPPARAAHSIARSVHRIVGTIAGVGVTAVLLVWSPPALVVIGVVVVCQFFAEMLVGHHYGWALVFITPMALSVVFLANSAPLGTLVVDRVIETILGAGIAIALVFLARWSDRSRGGGAVSA